jgi:hypothetical protein
MPWKPAALSDLEREKRALQMAVLKLRQELESKQTYTSRLEFLLRERSERIDQLTGVIDQLRTANQKLGLENDCLTALLAAPPQLDAAMLAPK